MLYLQVLFYCPSWLTVQLQAVFFQLLSYRPVLGSFLKHPHQMNQMRLNIHYAPRMSATFIRAASIRYNKMIFALFF